MPSWIFDISDLEPLRRYRIDTEPGSDSAASIQRPGMDSLIDGSEVKASQYGTLPRFTASTPSLYAKPIDAYGNTGVAVPVSGTWDQEAQGYSEHAKYAADFGWSRTNSHARNAAALQSALDSLQPGEDLYFPPGSTTEVTTTLVLPTGSYIVPISIHGNGHTIKQAAGANLDQVIAHAPALSTGTGTEREVGGRTNIIDLRIDGNRANQTGGLGRGALLTPGQLSRIILHVRSTRGDGIVLAGTNASGNDITTLVRSAVEVDISGSTAFYCWGLGVHVQRPSAGPIYTDGFARGVVPAFCQHDGLRIDSPDGWLVEGCHPYAIGLSGIMLQNAYATRVVNNYVEGFGALDSTAKDWGFATGAWDSGVTYGFGQVVTYNSAIYISTQDGNIGNTPGSGGAWRAYITNGTSVGGIVSLKGGFRRPVHLHGNQVSIGHTSFALRSEWGYSTILAQGPASGSIPTIYSIIGNTCQNEYQQAGSNTTGLRVSAGTGGVRLIKRSNIYSGGSSDGGFWRPENIDASVTSPHAPTCAVGAGAGTGATVDSSSRFVDDGHGRIVIVAGTSPAAGTLCQVTYARPLIATAASAPALVVMEQDITTRGLGIVVQPLTSGGSVTGFTVVTTNAPVAGTTYKLDYIRSEW